MAGFLGPRARARIRARAAAPAAKPAAPVAPVDPMQVRATSIPYYDPSRVIKYVKIVQDMRQQGTERGEVQTGDNETLGPGSNDGQIAPPRTNGGVSRPPVTEKNVLIPIALAIGAFILLGG